jgi:hypothetical protein
LLKYWEAISMKEEQIIFGLRDELTRGTPDVWQAIRQEIARTVADSLMQELDGIPSPQGRLFGEIRDAAKNRTFKHGA